MYLDASGLDTTGRLLIVFFFLTAGIANLTPARIKDHIDRMVIFRTPFPTAAFWFGIALQFVGSLLLLIGWHADIGVYCLMLFTVAATAIFHRFWSKTDPLQRNISRMTLFSNIALFGALLLVLQNVRQAGLAS